MPKIADLAITIGHHILQKSDKPRGRKREVTIAIRTVFERNAIFL